MNWQAKRILVTGGSGFIGSALMRRLAAEGAEVVELARTPGRGKRVADLRNLASLQEALAGERFDAVFHLAAAGTGPGVATADVFSVNVLGTDHLLTALRPLETGRIVVAGSWTEYGSHDERFGEQLACEPRSPYGISKLASTLLSVAWAKAQNRPLTVARLFQVFGPGEAVHRLLPTLVKAACEGAAPALGSPDVVRDLVSVEQAVEGMLRLAELDQVGEVVNVGTGEPISIREIVERVRVASGSLPEPTWGSSAPRPWDVPRAVADVSKLRRLTGWVPDRTMDAFLEAQFRV
jgi:nucleoside-diphosphate-sugar epimerase